MSVSQILNQTVSRTKEPRTRTVSLKVASFRTSLRHGTYLSPVEHSALVCASCCHQSICLLRVRLAYSVTRSSSFCTLVAAPSPCESQYFHHNSYSSLYLEPLRSVTIHTIYPYSQSVGMHASFRTANTMLPQSDVQAHEETKSGGAHIGYIYRSR